MNSILELFSQLITEEGKHYVYFAPTHSVEALHETFGGRVKAGYYGCLVS
jgi:hypothetical protein